MKKKPADNQQYFPADPEADANLVGVYDESKTMKDSSPDGKGKAKGKAPKPTSYPCPFEIIVDTREQRPYTFQGIEAGADHGRLPMVINTVRSMLPVGDYSIHRMPIVVVERKSKADLYSSMCNTHQRENFDNRLRMMCLKFMYSYVVVEASLYELVNDPPRHTEFSPTSLKRTIDAWKRRWRGVHWEFMWDRDAAEIHTFRLLEGVWKDYQRGYHVSRLEFERYCAEGAERPAWENMPNDLV